MIALWIAIGLFDAAASPPVEQVGSGGHRSVDAEQEWEAKHGPQRKTLESLVEFDAPKPKPAAKPAPEAPQALPAPVAASLLPSVAGTPYTPPALVLEPSPDYTEAAEAMLVGQVVAQQAEQARAMAEELEMVGVLLAMLEAN